jgi:thiamine-phosphate pyrophosphorylase
MSKSKTEAAPSRAPRLMLFTPEVTDAAAFARAVEPVLAAADIAALVLRLADADERTLVNRIKALAPAVQERGAALLIAGRADIVARGGADGAHLAGYETFAAALDALKPERIAGCGGLATRHDAMQAADDGADYVMFGEPDPAGRRPSFAAIVERVEWWAEVFQVPCVAWAGEAAEVSPLAAAGADFVALGDWIWSDPEGSVEAIAAAGRALTTAEPAA